MGTKLFAFGSNGSGQLGLGHNDDLSVPTAHLDQSPFGGRSIKSLTAGGNHTLVLTGDGLAFAAGDGKSSGTHVPGLNHMGWWHVTVTALEEATGCSRVAFAAATWEASVFVAHLRNEVYSCGTGNKGELGQGEGVTHCGRPTKIPGFPPAGTRVVDLAACVGHAVAVLDNGEVWGWGAGRKEQLGPPAGIVWRPRKLEGVPFKAVRATCGREFTIAAAEPEDGAFVVLGSDKYDVRTSGPRALPGWKQIEASWSGVYALSNKGQLLCWGRDDRGQLPGRRLPPIAQIAAGSEHALARTKEGAVLAWGWGEHGNCGEHGAEGEGEVHRIGGGKAVSFVGAGCATSFVVV